ncbi:DUF2795 domain-containing protein [Caballeronia sp. M23-90]
MTDTRISEGLNYEPINDEIAQVLRDVKFPANKDGIVDAAQEIDHARWRHVPLPKSHSPSHGMVSQVVQVRT